MTVSLGLARKRLEGVNAEKVDRARGYNAQTAILY